MALAAGAQAASTGDVARFTTFTRNLGLSKVNTNALAARYTKQNNDLFRALKGGGPNFGIVSRYDLNTVPVYEVWAEMRYYSVEQASAVIDAFMEWQLNGALDVKSNVAIDISLTAIVIGLVYSEPANNSSAFAPFYDLEPESIPVPGINTTFVVIDELLGSAFPDANARHDYRGCSTRTNANLTRDVYDYWLEKAQAAYQATGLDIRPGPQQWWTTLVDWENAADDEAARSVCIETTKVLENPLESCGLKSVKHLKATAKKFDPTQMFQRLQKNGFLLSKV
ncbi:uncharacterized protein BO97DRAFT_424117 [Aspergillus homomorphus CBS 101889]|uniref:Uncharacterized protein n=1 Tax=Aspergillus homomorphus (strain CBS 101889) TaxID=1450537 RepID=A0A395HZT0_ASPHC|nr:hypothetical protein BO97DRAFT_424117 [Aspergillus homomorphus CBS 101889]RAL12939.1 hypothetical protein BO97DRAFT_424117 [Aspergillus homomorphus CBS 101889]